MRSVTDNNLMVQELLRWFRLNGRDLPWRRTYDPYHVWISEIMLQQTQMERGVDYFLRWIERFPDVAAVAEAEEQEILKYWQGLGYYARARNLHRAAKKIVDEHHGEVPGDCDQLLALPGIGSYTAAAIASVAGNYDIAVVDANVSRVYARIYDIGEPIKDSRVRQRIAAIAAKHLPVGKARAYNQAIMDFGALICRPRNPLCERCPVARWCKALQEETTGKRPVSSPRKKSVAVQKVAALILDDGRIFIQQRKKNVVWGGLWEFPGGEIGEGSSKEEILAQRVLDSTGLSIKVLKPITSVVHQYTHHQITLNCYLCAIDRAVAEPALNGACAFRWVYPDQLDDFGFPAGPRKILEYIYQFCPEILG